MNTKEFSTYQISSRKDLDKIINDYGSKLDLKGKDPLRNILNYVQKNGCNWVVAEFPYQDAEYLDEFKNFHSTVFRNYGRDCHRLHFFNNNSRRRGFINKYLDGKGDSERLGYLGFSVIRPTERNRVGRTVLGLLEEEKTGIANKAYITSSAKFTVTFGKTEITLRGVPYIQSDRRVMVCAHAALWTSLRIMHQKFGFPSHRPFEITKSAMRHRGQRGRMFPSEGLTMGDMLNALINLNYSPVSLAVPEDTKYLNGEDDTKREGMKKEFQDSLQSFIYNYLESGIPVISGVREKKKNELKDIGHTFTIVGHTLNKDEEIKFGNEKIIESREWVTGFIIQDDLIGPYQIIPFQDKRNDLLAEYGKERISKYSIEDLTLAIIPIPSSVSFPSEHISMWAKTALSTGRDVDYLYDKAFQTKPEYAKELLEAHFKDDKYIVIRSQLMKSNYFKMSNRICCFDKTKEESMCSDLYEFYRDMDMPVFIWVCDITTSDEMKLLNGTLKNYGEIIFDATAYPESPIPYLSIHIPGIVKEVFVKNGKVSAEYSKIEEDRPYLSACRYYDDVKTREVVATLLDWGVHIE